MEGFFRFNRAVMLAGKIVIGAIMLAATFLLFFNVVLRYCFSSGIVWAEEMTRYTLLWTVFLGAGVVAREGTHVSMEAFFQLWPKAYQRIGFLFVNLICLATICVIVYFGVDMVEMVVETGQVSEAAAVPMWIIYGAFPVGGCLMVLGYLETAVRQWRGLPIGPSDIALHTRR